MNKLPWALLFLVAAGLYNCGSSDDRLQAPATSGGEGGLAEAGGPGEQPAGQPSMMPIGGADSAGRSGDGGVPAAPEAGAAGRLSLDGGAGQGGQGGVVLADGVLVNLPYTCESPFAGVTFGSYFHLEDFETHALTTPGVAASTTTLSSSFGAGVVDSVDCDDGSVDGKCTNCDARWGNGSIEVTFDGTTLGELPTHVGMVWTDGGGGASVTITGYDAADAVIYTETVEGIGDASIYGTVEEDRFFGIVHYQGVKRVVVVNSTGGVEIDHLQYGR